MKSKNKFKQENNKSEIFEYINLSNWKNNYIMSSAELQRMNNRRNDEGNPITNVRTRTYVLVVIFLLLDFVEPA